MSGFTHNFYRYPARFSPKFVRAVIETFTKPGELVFDPFVGGGTTLVEALALGRYAIGTDISALATFVSEVKTTLLDDREIATLADWAQRLADRVHMHSYTVNFNHYEEEGYYKHLDTARTWRLRKAIEQSLGFAMRLPTPTLEAFARCVILRTAQWALDARKRLPTVDEFRVRLAGGGMGTGGARGREDAGDRARGPAVAAGLA